MIIFCLFYYAPLSRPEGPRRCPDRGNAGGALVFLAKFYTIPSVPRVSYVTTVTTVTIVTTVTPIFTSTKGMTSTIVG